MISTATSAFLLHSSHMKSEIYDICYLVITSTPAVLAKNSFTSAESFQIGCQIIHFCEEIVLLVWRKLSGKFCLWRKMTKMRMDMERDKSAGVGGLQRLFAQIWRTAVHLLSSQPARYGKRSKEFSGLCPARKFLLLPLIILHLLVDIKFTLYMGVQYNHHILVKLTFCFFFVLQGFYFLGKAKKSTLLTDVLLLFIRGNINIIQTALDPPPSPHLF